MHGCRFVDGGWVMTAALSTGHGHRGIARNGREKEIAHMTRGSFSGGPPLERMPSSDPIGYDTIRYDRIGWEHAQGNKSDGVKGADRPQTSSPLGKIGGGEQTCSDRR